MWRTLTSRVRNWLDELLNGPRDPYRVVTFDRGTDGRLHEVAEEWVPRT